MKPYLKNKLKAKRAGVWNMAQVEEHLLSKYEVLNSNPSNAPPPKKKAIETK
jgi:hypothetical protein